MNNFDFKKYMRSFYYTKIEKVNRIKGDSELITECNKLIDELNLLNEKINKLQNKEVNYHSNKISNFGEIADYLKKSNKNKNVIVDFGSDNRIETVNIKFKCSKSYFLKNIHKNIKITHFIDIGKYYYFSLIDFKFDKNKFYKYEHFQKPLTDYKFSDVTNDIENIFKSSELVELYATYIKNCSLYHKINNKINDLNRLVDELKKKIAILDLITNLIVGLIYNHSGITYKILKIENNSIVVESIDVCSEILYTFEQFYNSHECFKFDLQSERYIKYSKLEKI